MSVGAGQVEILKTCYTFSFFHHDAGQADFDNVLALYH